MSKLLSAVTEGVPDHVEVTHGSAFVIVVVVVVGCLKDDLVQRCVSRCLRTSAALTVARTAKEARELVRGRPFDVIVSDLSLPDGNGLGVLGEAAGFVPAAKLVLYSGFDPPPAVAEALRAGRRSAFLRQPEGFTERLALVRRWASETA